MVDPTLIAAGGIVAAIAAGAAYSYFTGNEASVDTDGDGDDELTFGDDESSYGEQPTNETLNFPDNLTDIAGVGPTKAAALEDVGLETPSDVYYASDENVTDATGVSSGVLNQIRNDIGGIDYEDE